jgi:ATP-dependent RNA helicase DeaD
MATSTTPTQPEAFAALGLRDELLTSLAALGYEEPTPVQAAAIPPLLEGRDVLGQAATGTGKTAAFALPLLHRLTPGAAGPFEARALVVCPTRELAVQVAEAVHSYGKSLGVTVLPIYGGADMQGQLRRLRRGVDVVIATPGRALDHVRRRTLKLEHVQTVVLDEADEMLDLGFAEDLDALLSALPEGRQTALFSATLAPRIAALAEAHLDRPVRVNIAPKAAESRTLPNIRQAAYVVPRAMKEVALGRLLDLEAPRSAILFCRTRLEVDRLTELLAGRGYDVAGLHGGLSQEQRERVLRAFKTHKLELLVATDVAARGLDVEKLSHVINYDLPTSPEVYVHRIGRTGRAGHSGVALTLLEPKEQRLLKNVERTTRQPIPLGRLPTLVDVRARKRDLTRAAVEAQLGDADSLEPWRGAVDALSATADLADVAAAALAALHGQLHPGDAEEPEVELPTFEPPAPRTERKESHRKEPARGEAKPRRGETKTHREPEGGWDRIFIGLGARAGLRVGDLVGAIANEADLERTEIGAVQLGDLFSFVEVAAGRGDDVIRALTASTLRGRKVKVERDRGSRTPRAPRSRD